MWRLLAGIFLSALVALCVSGCGSAYGFGGAYPRFGYAPYWGGFVEREPRFAAHRPWEDHWHAHSVGFYHGAGERLANARHFGGFHGGFHGGGDHR
jgi:hypothetical protein